MKQNIIIACLVLIVLGLGYLIFFPEGARDTAIGVPAPLATTAPAPVAETEVVVEPLEKEALETLINDKSSNLLNAHPQIAEEVELVFDNLLAEEKAPSTFDGIFEKLIMGDWNSVKVTSVHYVQSGKIDQVTLHINHMEN